MFSERTYDDVRRLTQRVLQEIHVRQVIERVPVIHAYVQLCAGSPEPALEKKLILNVQDLAELTKQYRKLELAEELEALVARMDQERGP
jgi:hypothetical protein